MPRPHHATLVTHPADRVEAPASAAMSARLDAASTELRTASDTTTELLRLLSVPTDADSTSRTRILIVAVPEHQIASVRAQFAQADTVASTEHPNCACEGLQRIEHMFQGAEQNASVLAPLDLHVAAQRDEMYAAASPRWPISSTPLPERSHRVRTRLHGPPGRLTERCVRRSHS